VTPEEVSRSVRLLAVGEILLRDLGELADPEIEPLRSDIRRLCERLRKDLEAAQRVSLPDP
jgi:ElaB/YqjD/DUF883 family membrane-anchored ribosome-binding protein